MKGGAGTERNRATDYDISNFFFHLSQQGKCVLLKSRFTMMLNQLAFSVFALMTGRGGDSQYSICIFDKVDFMSGLCDGPLLFYGPFLSVCRYLSGQGLKSVVLSLSLSLSLSPEGPGFPPAPLYCFVGCGLVSALYNAPNSSLTCTHRQTH